MSEALRKLERDVEREMTLLAALPPAAPRRSAVDAVRAAVRSEASRLAVTARRTTGRRWLLGCAAAAAMIAALVLPRSTALDTEPDLDAWLAAMDASSAKLVAVVAQDSLPHEWRGEEDASAELEAWSESLDATFDQFGAL